LKTKREDLIKHYEELKELKDITPQRRGQLFNSFVARVLNSYNKNFRAISNNNEGTGEIDVAFIINGTRYILEAKWEKNKVSEGPIAKIRTRVNQRLAGTIGVLLSMSGFTSDSLEEMKIGQRLEIILLSKEHFEAMLYGFVDPITIFDNILNNAHFIGLPYSPLLELSRPSFHIEDLDWEEKYEHEFEFSKKFKLDKLIATNNKGFTYLLRCYSNDELITQYGDYLYKLNFSDSSLKLVNGIPNLLDFLDFNNNEKYFLRENCIGKYSDGKWSFIKLNHYNFGANFLAHSSGRPFIIINKSNNHSGTPKREPSELLDIKNMTRITLPEFSFSSCCTEQGTFLSISNKQPESIIYEIDINGEILNELKTKVWNPKLIYANKEEVLILERNELKALNLKTNEVQTILKYNEQLATAVKNKYSSNIYFSAYKDYLSNASNRTIFKLAQRT